MNRPSGMAFTPNTEDRPDLVYSARKIKILTGDESSNSGWVLGPWLVSPGLNAEPYDPFSQKCKRD